jgi:hypothetical protein
MKKATFDVSTILLVGIALMLVSCLEELDKTDKIANSTLQPAIEFPLINSEFNLEEFLTEGNSKADIYEQDGLMVITYDDSVSTPIGDVFFFLPDQQSPTLSITGPEVAFPSTGGSVVITKSMTFAFNTSQGESLDSIMLKAGQMMFQMNSTFTAGISASIDILSLRIGGSEFQQDFTFNGPDTQNPSIDLQGSLLDLTVNGTNANTISFSITVTITDTGQPINATDRFDCSFGLNGLQFRGMFGDLGSPAFPFSSDSIDVDVFDNAFSGTVELLSPAITLNLKNSFGIPIGFDIQNISAIKSNTTIDLSGSAVGTPNNPYRLDAPSHSQIGETVTTQIALTPTNSNIPQLISSLPNFLSYRFGIGLNPGLSPAKNFVMDDSRLNIGVHLELPFHGRMSGLSISKQFDFDGLGIDDIEQSFIKLKTVNELPLDVDIQIYFTDVSGNVLDSLFTNPSIIKGANVDANGFTETGAEWTSEVTVTQAKIDRIEQAEYLVMTATMSTTNKGTVPVKFAATDKIKIALGVHTRITYELN